MGDPGSVRGLGRSPGEGNGNPLQYSCLENHGLKSLAGFSPLGRKESDMTEQLRHTRKCTCGNKEAIPDIGKIMSKDRELEDSFFFLI